jgi:hypothetical protein
MTETGTEKRVDELSKRVNFGFEQIDGRFEQVDRRNRLRMDTKAGFDSLHQLIIRVCAGTIGSIVAGVVALFLSHS